MIISKVLLRRTGILAQIGNCVLASRSAYLCNSRKPQLTKGLPMRYWFSSEDPKQNKPNTPESKPDSNLHKSSEPQPTPSPPTPEQPEKPPQEPRRPPHRNPIIYLQETLNNLLDDMDRLEADRVTLYQQYQILKSNELPQIMNMMKTKSLESVPSRLEELKSKLNMLRVETVKELEALSKNVLEEGDGLFDKVDTVSKNTKAMAKVISISLNDIHQMLLSLQVAAQTIQLKVQNQPWMQQGKSRKKWRKEQLSKHKEEQALKNEEKTKTVYQKIKESYEEYLADKSPGEGFWKSIYNFGCDALRRFKGFVTSINPIYLIAFALLYAFFPKDTSYSERQFQSLLKQGKIQNLRLVDLKSAYSFQKHFEFSTIDGKKGYYYSSDSELTYNKLRQDYPNIIISPEERSTISMIAKEYIHLLSGISIVCYLIYMAVGLKNMKTRGPGGRGGGEGGLAFNKQKFDMNKHVNVRFTDVAGLEQSKLEIQEFVDFLKNPKKYEQLGARIPKGALLTGPPGTGKTMLAKATAGEAGVPFFFVSGSDFVQMFVGLGAARVRDLFKQAKANSPSIIFIDEIDAIGKKRDSGIGSNDERDGTLNQLLVEMDGFGTDAKVIVIAATNRKELLDNALTRPGRLDRMIEVSLPDLAGRKQIFMVHLKPLQLSPIRSADEYARRLATLTPGFSGADIANLCNQAAIVAARANKETVEPIDFEMATERIIGGLEKRSIMSEQEREVVAVHESGHAVVSWFLEGAYPLLKLTIIPRSKGSLGFAQYLPSETRLQTKEQLLDRICFTLAGRCAQQFIFKRITTGAADDLDKAYKIANALVTKYGMSQKLGFIGYRDTEYMKPYSTKMAKLIDQEIKVIIDRCVEITRGMVIKYQPQIRKLSQELIKKETLDGKQIRAILGDRPFAPHSSYKAYLEMQQEDELQKALNIPPPQPSPSA